jgi:hypothetical protein
MSASSVLKKVQVPPLLNLNPHLKDDPFEVLATPQSVLLNYSLWKNPFLFRATVQVVDDGFFSLKWSSAIQTSRDQLDLLHITHEKVLTGQDAFFYAQNNLKSTKGVEENNTFIIGTTETLIIVFSDEKTTEKWANSFMHCIVRPSYDEGISDGKSFEFGQPSLRIENFGAIYDIEETGNTNDLWKEIKLTFIKEDSSHFEYLNYDKSQKNLAESSREVIESVEDSIDQVNKKILQSYLKTVELQENIKRVEDIEGFQVIKTHQPESLDFSRKTNSVIRESYGALDGNEIISELLAMLKIYKGNKGYCSLSDSFQLLYMQKLALSAEMHQLACEYQINSLKKKLNLDENDKVNKVTEGNDTPSKIREEEEAKKHAMKVEKSCLRGACECIVS